MRTITALFAATSMLALTACETETAQQAQPRAFVVYFQRGSAELTPEAQAIVSEVAGAAQKSQRAEITVEGVADRGNRDADLAARRAAAVEQALHAAGISEAEVSVRGTDTATEAGGVAARRVKITLVAEH
jgi:cytochrome c oxidase subunit II